MLFGSRVSSRGELVRACNQIPVEETDTLKIVATKLFGLFCIVRMPFVLSDAAQTLRRFMHEVTRGSKNTYVYLDDILGARHSEK